MFGVSSAGQQPDDASGQSILSVLQNEGKGLQDKSVDQLKSEFDYYGLFLDPEDLIYYRKIFGRDDFIRMESIVSEDEDHPDEHPLMQTH